MSQPSRTFGTRLREVRTRRKISQRELVEWLRGLGFDLHQPAISGIESGKRQLSFDEAVAIARFLKIPLEALYMSWEDWLVFESEFGLG